MTTTQNAPAGASVSSGKMQDNVSRVSMIIPKEIEYGSSYAQFRSIVQTSNQACFRFKHYMQETCH